MLGRLNYFYHFDKTQLSDSVNSKYVSVRDYGDEELLKFCDSAINLQEQSGLKNSMNMFALKHGGKILGKTRTDMIGVLDHGSMFLLSENQWNKLLKSSEIAKICKNSETVITGTENQKKHHLDLGSGDGEVLIPLSQSIKTTPYCTEISISMQNRLKQKNFTIIEHDNWLSKDFYSTISMLNLLDRCHNPHDMLASAQFCEPENLIVSAVFPVLQSVEYLPNKKNFQKLPVAVRASFEDQFAQYVEFVERFGFILASWTKTPYISTGSKESCYHVLENATMVFKFKN